MKIRLTTFVVMVISVALLVGIKGCPQQPPPDTRVKTTLTISVDPPAGAKQGDVVSFTANLVLASQTGQKPTGALKISVDGATKPADVANLTPVDDITWHTPNLSAGTHKLVAEYAGDSHYQPSKSAELTYTIAAVYQCQRIKCPGTMKDGVCQLPPAQVGKPYHLQLELEPFTSSIPCDQVPAIPLQGEVKSAPGKEFVSGSKI